MKLFKLMHLLEHLPSRNRRSIILFIDFLIFYLGSFLAEIVIYKSWDYFTNLTVVLYMLILSTLSVLLIYFFGIYRNKTKFITAKIIPKLLVISFLSSTILFVFDSFLNHAAESKSLVYFYLVISMLIAFRFAAREVLNFDINTSKENVVIYGAGKVGQQILNAYQYSEKYQPIAIIDNDPALQQKLVSGLPVYKVEDTFVLKKKYDNFFVVFSEPKNEEFNSFSTYKIFNSLDIEVKVIPQNPEDIDRPVLIEKVRDVRMEDLLGRQQREPDRILIDKLIKNKVVMVTGAGGSIGSELCNEIIKSSPRQLILYENSEHNLYRIHSELIDFMKSFSGEIDVVPILGDILDPIKLVKIIKKCEVDTIYHAAAYKHVPMVEGNIISGVQNNILGTANLVDVCRGSSVQNLILISTDKAVRPTNIMGATKRVSELIIQSASLEDSKTIFSAVRFGNVLGSSGSVIPRFKKQIQAGGPVTVTHPEITRFFMTIKEAAQLVIQAGAMSKGGEIYLLDMGSSVKILDLAKTMINLAGHSYYLSGHQKPSGDSIEIAFNGLRPGEKLFEELLVDKSSLNSEHPSIFLENKFTIDSALLKKYLTKIDKACSELNEEKVISILKEMPIEYSRDVNLDIKPFIGIGSKKEIQTSNTKGFTEHANPKFLA